MLDKILELLGEELASKVQEALGDVELAIMNNGSVVRADKYDTLKEDHRQLTEKYQTDISGLNSKLDGAMTNAADYEALKGTLNELKVENEKIAQKYQQELKDMRIDKDIERMLLDANLNPEYLPLLKTQLNRESLVYDGDNLIGASDFVAKKAQEFPGLFGETKKLGTPPEKHLNVPVGKKQQLIKEYNQAELNRDAKAMARLSKEIKAIKE